MAPDGRVVLAVCDSDIVGRKIEDDKRVLDLDSDFYKGENVSEETAENMVKKAYIVNLVGEKSVKMGIRMGLVSEDIVIDVNGVKHAQIVNESNL